ncbi:MAG: penicillin-binding protein activator [Myxococcota bacterium]|nr:penicillin-binding protein activator [Myxococcota bacterium]
MTSRHARTLQRDRLNGRVCLLICVAFAVSCAGGPAREATDAEYRAFEAAARAARTQPEEGVRRFTEFLNENPKSALADDAAAQLAELSLQAADEERAKDWLYLIIREYPGEDNADRARVLLAGMEARADRPRDARRLLAKVRFARLPPAERRLAYRLFADLSDDAVDRLSWQVRERLAVLEELEDAEYESPVLGGGLEDLEREIAASVDAMTDEHLVRAGKLLRGEVPSGRALLLLARRALERGEFPEASDWFRKADGLEFLGEDQALFDEVSLAVELRERIVDGGERLPSFRDVAALPQPAYETAKGVIGVVLPLSGRFAPYGEKSLQGVLAAARIFDPSASIAAAGVDADDAGEPSREAAIALESGDEDDFDDADEGHEEQTLRLVIRDSEGTAEAAALAIESLAAEKDLVAIIGPLLGDTAEAAAPIADELGIPLIALTSREEVPQNRSYVFRLRTSPRDEIRTLIDHASNELGAERYAILYPKDNYGRGMRDHFWEAVSQAGGKVVASSGYDITATDFAEPIRNMIGFALLTRAEKAALENRDKLIRSARRLEPEDARMVREIAYAIPGPEGDPLPPQVDFDVLFIPDGHNKIVLIAPQLTFHEIDGVSLLGPSGWNHPELVTIGRAHVRGAVISALFHEGSAFPFVSNFVDGYEQTFAGTPDVFAAHGYDAARLVMAQLVAGAETREGVRNGILRTQAFPGASGVINISPDGNARKRPFLLKVRGGRLISLD